MGKTPNTKAKEIVLPSNPPLDLDESSMVTIHSVDEEIEGEILQEILIPAPEDQRIYEYCCSKCETTFKNKQVIKRSSKFK